MFEAYGIQWMLLVTVFGAAVMAPGPDFVMAVRNAVLYSRRAGILTAIGFAAGFCIHMAYTVIGIAALIAQSVFIFSLIKYAGAAYLFYIGIKALRSKGFDGPVIGDDKAAGNYTNGQALRDGFLTNLLNPKATLFCLAVFTQFVTPETPLGVQLAFAATCVAMVAGWFSLVAVILTQRTVRRKFLSAAGWIDRLCGALFIGLGIKLALAKAAP